jgi:hypothetical protein
VRAGAGQWMLVSVRPRIMYVELKTGHSGDGPAWIGRVHFSKSGRTVYYRGLTLQRANGISGNHIDAVTGDEYWVSGPHRDRRDRLFGDVPVHVDDDVRDEYRALTG